MASFAGRMKNIERESLLFRSTVRKIMDVVTVSNPARSHRILHHLNSRRYVIALSRLVKAGVKLDVVYDVGANEGQWTRDTKEILLASSFYLFEANQAHAQKLEPLGRSFIGLLSDRERDVAWYGDGGAGDSYYQERHDRYDRIAKVTRRAVPLDSLVSEHALPCPDFLKIDTQGSEIDILKGASQCLEHCSLVLLECPLVDYNTGAPNMSAYLDYMRDKGFFVYQPVEEHYKGELMVQIDFLFMRDREYLRVFPDAEANRLISRPQG
jgi:FkbM family methyltransferase